MPRQLHRLVYRSDSNISHGDIAGLDAIFRVSIHNNARDNLTGALALPDGKFVQVVEGYRADLDALMLRIESDRRHSNIARLSDRPVDARLFAGWGMARPDPTPLGDQAFRIITEDGSGAQVTGLLLKLSEAPTGMFV